MSRTTTSERALARRRYAALLLAYRDLLVVRNAAEMSLSVGLTGPQCDLVLGVANEALAALERLEEIQDGGQALPQGVGRQVEVLLAGVEQERRARQQTAQESEG